jgi:peptidoglycan/xylan/chitin deacetylase (PgdA/CDA1 family)
LRATIGLNATCAAGLAFDPAAWRWWVGAVAANHALMTVAGLWPRSTLLGPNLVRLPAAAARRGEVALTIDDGPDPQVTPAVLDLLGQAGVRASFFCIGEAVRRHPALARRIVADGHAIENHSERHPHHFAMFGLGGFRREVAAAQHTITDATGVAPRFFRAPAGLRNPLLQPVLAELGLTLASWTRRGFDTVRNDPERVRARLEHGLAAGDILLVHDGHAARDATGTPVVLRVLPGLIARLRDAGLRPVTLEQGVR